MADPLRVMIVDDHPLIKIAMRVVLTEAGMTVVAECDDGDQVMHAADAAQPDVVIMDVSMPTVSGIEATKDLLIRWPAIRVLIVTASTSARTLQQAAAAGAAGYLVKTGDAQVLVDAVRTVAAGGTVWPPTRRHHNPSNGN